jgi:hypothetical protein
VLNGLGTCRQTQVDGLGFLEVLYDLLAFSHDADDGVAGLAAGRLVDHIEDSAIAAIILYFVVEMITTMPGWARQVVQLLIVLLAILAVISLFAGPSHAGAPITPAGFAVDLQKLLTRRFREPVRGHPNLERRRRA